MAIRLYTGKRYKLKAESDDYGLSGAMEIVDGKSTNIMKYVRLQLGDYWLNIEREDLIRMYEFVMKKASPKIPNFPLDAEIVAKKAAKLKKLNATPEELRKVADYIEENSKKED